MADATSERVHTQPILRWAGSKRRLVPLLLRHKPRMYRRYIEPFAGSACLFFSLQPARAVLGDINSDLLETYSVLRETPIILAALVHQYPATKREYYRIRSLVPSTLSRIERAARFIYLNRYCFNGVYRTNRNCEFNVPRGTRTGRIPTVEVFRACAKILRKAELRPVDFAACLDDAKKGDFVYLDPPYATETNPRRGEYGYRCLENKDQDRLIETLHRLDNRGVLLLLSYSNTRGFVKSLPRSWRIRRIQVRRHVAGFAHHRTSVSEIVVSNYEDYTA